MVFKASAHRSRTKATWLWLLVLFVSGRAAVLPQENPDREYEIKSAFLYNFAKFVEWPAAAFADKQAPLVIGVLGHGPFGGSLERVIGRRTVRDRPVVVRRIATTDEARKCHIVFIPATEWKTTRHFLQGLGPSPVLTVGEVPDFCRFGGGIGFVREADHVRFEVNLAAAHAAGLTLSSQLLQVAREVLRSGQE